MQEWKPNPTAPVAAQTANGIPQSGPDDAQGGLSLLDLILILLNRKWFILAGLAVFSVASVLISVFVLESKYTAEAVVMPSKGKSFSPLGGLMGDMPLGGLLKSFDLFGQDNNSRFLTILESRRLADKVIQRFDLIHRYGFDKKRKYYYETVLKEFHKNVEVGEDQLDNIRIAVTDSNPQAAAEMANYIVDELDTISFQITRQTAQGSRMFFQERMSDMKKTLDSVHQAFAEFQTKHNFIDLETQVKSSIEALAGVEAEAMAADIETQLLSTSFGSNSRMAEARKKKAVLDKRIDEYMNEGSGSLVIPLKKAPELAIQYAYLFRDVKVYETIYAFILQMYEQARFQEANNSPTVSVLEHAQVPQKRTRPKRAVICMLGFFIGLIALSTWVLIAHWFGLQRARRTDVYVKLRKIRGHFLPG